MPKTTVEVPTPSNEEVSKWLNAWDALEDYTEQEAAINDLFQKICKTNDNLRNILIKCSVLNDFYSTNIYKVFPVAKHIQSIEGIDERLEKGDISIVNEIALNTIAGKNKNFYSFATKYCSHHNQKDYPIYDSYVDEMLRYFRKRDHFSKFKNEELKNYSRFKEILLEFKDHYKLGCSLKDLDRYLWQAGKKYFPKDYSKM